MFKDTVDVFKDTVLNSGHEGRDYQPYLITTLPGSDRDSNTGDCGASS